MNEPVFVRHEWRSWCLGWNLVIIRGLRCLFCLRLAAKLTAPTAKVETPREWLHGVPAGLGATQANTHALVQTWQLCSLNQMQHWWMLSHLNWSSADGIGKVGCELFWAPPLRCCVFYSVSAGPCHVWCYPHDDLWWLTQHMAPKTCSSKPKSSLCDSWDAVIRDDDYGDEVGLFLFFVCLQLSVCAWVCFNLSSTPLCQADSGLSGDADRGGDPSAYCGLRVPWLGPQGY